MPHPGAEPRALEGISRGRGAPAYSQDGRYVVLGTPHGLHRWDLDNDSSSPAELKEPELSGSDPLLLASEGRWVAAAAVRADHVFLWKPDEQRSAT